MIETSIMNELKYYNSITQHECINNSVLRKRISAKFSVNGKPLFWNVIKLIHPDSDLSFT